MAAGQTGNWIIFVSYSWVRTQAVLGVVQKNTGQKETPAQRKLRVVLHFRLIIWIHRDKRMQMKSEALLIAEHTGIIQHQQLFFHLFFACSRYSCSLWTVLGMHTPRCRARALWQSSNTSLHTDWQHGNFVIITSCPVCCGTAHNHFNLQPSFSSTAVCSFELNYKFCGTKTLSIIGAHWIPDHCYAFQELLHCKYLKYVSELMTWHFT